MLRYLNIDEEIFINQFSQGLHKLNDMDEWFERYDEVDKKAIISNLLNMVVQSHATVDEIRSAAELIGKEKSPATIKLMNPRKPYSKFGWEICSLPEKELSIGFNVLLMTLSISDGRRKAEEKYCNHWWHRDLSDEKYLEELRRTNGK